MTDRRSAALAMLLSPAELATLARAGRLSAQERACFVLLGRGRATKQVAADLGLSPKTVETHVARLRGKLGEEGRSLPLADLLFLARLWVRAHEVADAG